MSDTPTGDPIFAPEPIVPQAPSSGPHTKHRSSDKDWVVVHRGGAGSKAHVDALERRLIKAHINARVEHDDEGRVVLEVHRDDEQEAIAVLGDGNVSGLGDKPHQTAEERIQAEEKAELSGPFKAATMKWLLVIVAIATLGLLTGWAVISILANR
jgi:hypothetical protein